MSDKLEYLSDPKTLRRIFGANTAIARGAISAPMREWESAGMLYGDVLDYGAGLDPHKYPKYDPFHADADPRLLLKQYDTITLNYVLQVQPSDHLVVMICALVSRMLTAEGLALIALRDDVKESGFTPKGYQRASDVEHWRSLLSAIFSEVTIYPNKQFIGFVCRP